MSESRAGQIDGEKCIGISRKTGKIFFRTHSPICYRTDINLNTINPIKMIKSASVFPIESIQKAVEAIAANSGNKPLSDELVSLLLDLEKTAKSCKDIYPLDALVGDWRLCFITGTKKTRKRAGIALGAGRYLPKFVKIKLSYTALEPEDDRISDSSSNDNFEKGWVQNQVKLGALQFSLTGPIKFLKTNNILAFDFTHMTVRLFGTKVYDRNIRGGSDSREEFDRERLGKQAFFNYFWIGERAIAARGRGGGLALWLKENCE